MSPPRTAKPGCPRTLRKAIFSQTGEDPWPRQLTPYTSASMRPVPEHTRPGPRADRGRGRCRADDLLHLWQFPVGEDGHARRRRPGEKLLLSRNAHKSVIAGVIVN